MNQRKTTTVSDIIFLFAEIFQRSKFYQCGIVCLTGNRVSLILKLPRKEGLRSEGQAEQKWDKGTRTVLSTLLGSLVFEARGGRQRAREPRLPTVAPPSAPHRAAGQRPGTARRGAAPRLLS